MRRLFVTAALCACSFARGSGLRRTARGRPARRPAAPARAASRRRAAGAVLTGVRSAGHPAVGVGHGERQGLRLLAHRPPQRRDGLVVLVGVGAALVQRLHDQPERWFLLRLAAATGDGEIWARPDEDTAFGRLGQAWTAGSSYPNVDIYPGRVNVSATRDGAWSTFGDLRVTLTGDQSYSARTPRPQRTPPPARRRCRPRHSPASTPAGASTSGATRASSSRRRSR